MSITQEHYASAPVGRLAPASAAVRAAAERRQKSGLALYRDNVTVALVNALAARYPVVTIWEANQSDDGDGMIKRWGAETAVVARPFTKVVVHRLPRGGHAFMAALLEGKTLAQAVEAGTAAAPTFDPKAALGMLV